MADRSKGSAIEALLSDLAQATIGASFNQLRESGPDDVPDAAAIRLENLRHYLAERAQADILAVGEAAGYQGMRWSGIAFTSERDLARWGLPYRPTSTNRKNGWSEPSGTIVHGVLDELGAELRVILWNTVPTHPHAPGLPLSNRRPTSQEIAEGRRYAERLIAIMKPRLLLGVGRIACAAFPEAQYIRHPAQSGATAFRLGMREALRGSNA